MKIGTSYFTSKRKAIKYFSTQELDQEAVEQKIKEGEIHIGMPPAENCTFYIDPEEGRYFRIEK